MKVYTVRSSIIVKLITIAVIIFFILLPLAFGELFFEGGKVFSNLFSIILLAVVFYFFTNSLSKIIVKEDELIFKKQLGSISFPFSEVVSVERIDFANLTMLYGSMGLFGYIGTIMSGEISYVKDRKNMLRVVVKQKGFLERGYLISSPERAELIDEIKNRIAKNKSDNE